MNLKNNNEINVASKQARKPEIDLLPLIFLLFVNVLYISI